MRVVCRGVHEFIENLEAERKGAVFGGMVYAERSYVEVNELKRMVHFRASAVVDLPDGGQYLLQSGEDCGFDYEDGGGEQDGTEAADELRKRLRHYCVACSYTLRPGLVDM